MTRIANKTHRPLSVPLPRGKTLHLGPGNIGQISSDAVAHPQLKALVDAGELEILGEEAGPSEGARGGRKDRPFMQRHNQSSKSRSSGDR